MVRFEDVDELRAHLLGWESVYGEYAELLWEEGGIRSTEMIAGYTPVVLADILATGATLRPLHTGRAHDMISRVAASGSVLHGVLTYRCNTIDMHAHAAPCKSLTCRCD
jgi:hypothetical protein